jgi:hypothetical protein
MSNQHLASTEFLKDGSQVTSRPLNKDDVEAERDRVSIFRTGERISTNAE